MMPHHRNIVRVFGMSEGRTRPRIHHHGAGTPEGRSLTPLKSHPQRNDWATLVRWALDIAHGLQYLHSLTPPVLHLDLKPQNVLLFDDDTAKLCDFGVVTCETPCSPRYAAPEQFATKPVCEAADIYGLGGVLFSMITKSEPWDGLSMLQICGKLMSDTPPSLPSPLPAQCPAKLAAIVQRCLQIDPQQRCSISRVIDDLAQIHDELVQGPSRITAQQLPRGGPRHPADASSPKSLLEILKQFESCPTPPGRSDIPRKYQNPTLKAIVAEYDHVVDFIPRENFVSDRDHEDAVAVGLYTDESFVYWLMNAWANDTSGERARGLAHVGPLHAASDRSPAALLCPLQWASRASLESRFASDAQCVRQL